MAQKKAKIKKVAKEPAKSKPAKKSATKGKASAKSKSAGKKAPAKTAAAKKSLIQTGAKKNSSQKSSGEMSHLISPLDDRVLVQVQKAERVTAGGLIIPDTAQFSGNQKAIVVAVGRGHRDQKGRIRPLELKVGDEILLPEHSGDFIEVAGQDLKILRESEILGIVE